MNLTSTNFGKQISKFKTLQILLQRYQALKRYEEALNEHNKAIERNKELELEWCYNKDNKDPDVDLGNGKVQVTLWEEHR